MWNCFTAGGFPSNHIPVRVCAEQYPTRKINIIIKESWGRGTGNRERMAVRRPSPPRERTIPARRQRGARGHQRGQGRRPVQSEPPHEPPSVGAARLTAGRGRVVLVLPDLSRCEGSRVPTPGECLACSSRLSQPTPCRCWPSQLSFIHLPAIIVPARQH